MSTPHGPARADASLTAAAPPFAPAPHELRVLLLAPTRRDAETTARLLSAARLDTTVCTDMAAMTRELAAGAGAAVFTDGALGAAEMQDFVDALARQPSWSDLPTLLLTRQRDRSPRAMSWLSALTNTTLLDLPCSTGVLVSAVSAALRGRRRQYQLREQFAALHAAHDALAEADRRKDEFIAMLSHELRNPLATLCSGLQLLLAQQRGGDDDLRVRERVLPMMERQSRLLVKLIDDLMDMSRVSTGKVVLERSRVDLRAVVRQALDAERVRARPDGPQLQALVDDAPLHVWGDFARLTQVLGNLLHNAVKYTPPGGSVQVRLARDGGQALLAVQDTGVGIPPQMLEKVFDLFTQVDRSLDRAQGGLGIGLSLVRRLVELHGGTVRAFSEGEGRGSRIEIRLPRAEPPAADDPPAAAGEPPPHGRRVLVVDDNRDAADSLALLLSGAGHAVRATYAGEDALRAAADFHPDVVLCDLGMPGMDGHAVARALRGDPRRGATRLVALTGWGSEDDVRRTRDSGFDAHLTKPVDLAELARLLGRVDR